MHPLEPIGGPICSCEG